jgi:hypothetical protein
MRKGKRFTEARIAELTNNPKKVKEILAWDGLSDTSNTIPGTIFAVAANVATDQIDNKQLIVGYDGETTVDYKTRKLIIMSDYVMEQLAVTDREIRFPVGE